MVKSICDPAQAAWATKEQLATSANTWLCSSMFPRARPAFHWCSSTNVTFHQYRATQNKNYMENAWASVNSVIIFSESHQRHLQKFSTAKISEKRSDHRIIWKKPLGKSTGTPWESLRNAAPTCSHVTLGQVDVVGAAAVSHLIANLTCKAGEAEAAKSWGPTSTNLIQPQIHKD